MFNFHGVVLFVERVWVTFQLFSFFYVYSIQDFELSIRIQYIFFFTFPFTNIGIIFTLCRLRIDIIFILYKTSAIRTNISKFTILTNINLVFRNCPKFLKFRIGNNFFKFCISNITIIQAYKIGWIKRLHNEHDLVCKRCLSTID